MRTLVLCTVLVACTGCMTRTMWSPYLMSEEVLEAKVASTDGSKPGEPSNPVRRFLVSTWGREPWQDALLRGLATPVSLAVDGIVCFIVVYFSGPFPYLLPGA